MEPQAAAQGSHSVGNWVLEGELGRGSFAVVWRARHATSGAPAAVKEINTDKLNRKLQESLASEVAVLSQTKHRNVVGLLDLLKDGSRIYIVLEYCAGGDLGRYIRRYGRVSEATARYFLVQLAEGLKELRRHNVIHRDLKPQNLLLSDATATPLVKIADFGFARSLAPQGLAETLCGSPLYMAPEILQFQKYDAKADLWSVGTILFELLTGRPPFNGTNHVHLLRNIERSEARLPEVVAQRLSAPCRTLIMQLLKRSPVQRLSFEEFFQHPFLTGALPLPAAGPAPTAAGQGQAGAAQAAQQQQMRMPPPQGVPPPAPLQMAVPAPTVPMGGQQPPVLAPRTAPNTTAAIAAAVGVTVLSPGTQKQTSAPEQQQQQPPGSTAPPQQQQQQRPPAPVLQPAHAHPLQDAGTASNLTDSFERDYVLIDSAHSGRGPRSGGSGAAGAAASRLSARSDGGGVRGDVSESGGSSALASRAEALLKGDTSEATAALESGGKGGGTQDVRAVAGADGDCCGAATAAAAAALTASGLEELNQRANRVQLLTRLLRAALSHLGSASGCGHADTGPLWLSAAPAASVFAGGGLVPAGSTIGPQAAAEAATAGMMPHDPPQRRAERAAIQLLALQLLHAVFCWPTDAGAEGDVCGGGPPGRDLSGVAAGGVSGAQQLIGAAPPEEVQALAAVGAELLRAVDAALFAAVSSHLSAMPHHAGWGADPGRHLGHDGAPDDAADVDAAPFEVPLPDAYAVLYDAALTGCRAAAVEELLAGAAPVAAAARYEDACGVLAFLSVDWPELGAAGPGLGPEERLRMHRLCAEVSACAAAAAAATMARGA